MTMLTIIKRNKTYKNRKLVIYDGKKKIAEVVPCWGWCGYSFTKRTYETHKQCRTLVMENLYWLLGHDCDFEEWNNSIEAWDAGKHIYGVPIDENTQPKSMFFEGEKEVALNSFFKENK
jgi:hypothetical protein